MSVWEYAQTERTNVSRMYECRLRVWSLAIRHLNATLGIEPTSHSNLKLLKERQTVSTKVFSFLDYRSDEESDRLTAWLQADIQTDCHTYRQTYRQIADRQIDTQAYRQTDAANRRR